MEYEKKDICEDCNSFGDLELEDACADSSVGYGLCCYKYICKHGCNWYCSFCFKKIQSDNIKYVCFLEHQFKKLFKTHFDNYNWFLQNNLPFKSKIQLDIIKSLNLNPTAFTLLENIKNATRIKHVLLLYLTHDIIKRIFSFQYGKEIIKYL